MKFYFFFIATMVISLQSSLIYSGTIDPNIPDSKYLECAEKFDYVGKLCGTYKDKTKFCASAVAIDNHHILTAAHVVKNTDTCYVHFNNKEFCIEKIIIHKDFDTQFGVADIAIGYCAQSFELKIYPSLYDDTDEIGKTVLISGYGITGTFNTGAIHSDQYKRAGSNIIDYIDKDMLVCNASKNNKTHLEFLIASGDSGGGLFIDTKLVGINSCVLAVDKNPNSSYNDESGHTRISKFIHWINDHRKP